MMVAVWKAPAARSFPESGPEPRPTLFLDRDGVLIRELDYLGDAAGVEVLPGVAEALVLAREAGFQLIGLSNQSGIGRGLFSEEDFGRVMIRLEELLDEAGAFLDGFFYCPHEPAAGCDCRKPAPGMLAEASRSFGWDPKRSWLIGDKSSDVVLARQAGLGAFLVLTGHGPEQVAEVRVRFAGDPRVRVTADLRAAVAAAILGREPGEDPA